MLNGPGFLAAVTFFGRAWPGSPLQRRGGSAPSNNGYRQVRQAAVNRKPSALTNQAGNLRSALAISLHETHRRTAIAYLSASKTPAVMPSTLPTPETFLTFGALASPVADHLP